jgi:hypothetical protein
MKCSVEIGSGDTIYLQSFMKNGTCVHAKLRLGLRNLKECKVGINYRRDS